MTASPTLMTAQTALAAAGARRRRISAPLVWSLTVDDRTGAGGPSLLLERCITLTLRFHPAVERWLADAGWDCGPTTASARRPGPATTDPRMLAAAEVLGAAAAAATRSARTVVDTSNGSIIATPGRLRVDGPPPVQMTVLEALDWVAGASGSGLVLVDRAWFRLARLAESAAVLRVPDRDPTAVEIIHCGKVTTLPALAAAAAMERHARSDLVAAANEAVDLMDMAAAGPAGLPGLYPHQDAAAAALGATEIGAVLATRPGGGKTVICAAALAQRRSAERVLVAVPAAVVPQWLAELATWAPATATATASTVEQLRRRLRNSEVVVTTHDVAARWASTARTRVALSIIDEANVLLTGSRRASGLWALRGLSDCGWALTGTPDEHGSRGSAADLVAWARGRRRGSLRPADPADLTPVLLADDADGTVPDLIVVTAPCTPEAADLEWLDRLAARTPDSAGLAGHQARKTARLGLGDPLAVGEIVTAVPVKRRAAVARLEAHAVEGGCALAFSSSVPLAEAAVAELTAAGVPAALLDASLTRSARVGLLGAFAAGDVKVLAITPGSQRGVNLQTADLVVHLDLPASAAEFEQRNARAARIGSRHGRVEVWVPYLAGTWDERWVQAFVAGDADPLACR